MTNFILFIISLVTYGLDNVVYNDQMTGWVQPLGFFLQAQRLERERLRLKAEFEAELQAKKEKEAAQQKMNEELKRAAEDR